MHAPGTNVWALTLGLVLLSASGVAAAPADASLFSHFKRLCLDTKGDTAKVTAAARSLHEVKDLPDDGMPLGLYGITFKGGRLWTSEEDAEGGYSLANGRGLDRGAMTDVCTVAAVDAKAVAELKAWLGPQVLPLFGRAADEGGMYAIVETGGARRSLTAEEVQNPPAGATVLVLTYGVYPGAETLLSLAGRAPTAR